MIHSTGNVKWYDPERGHGFIKPDEDGEDVFVHHSAVHGSGMKTLMHSRHEPNC
jgi:CspA family cold shock protein